MVELDFRRYLVEAYADEQFALLRMFALRIAASVGCEVALCRLVILVLVMGHRYGVYHILSLLRAPEGGTDGLQNGVGFVIFPLLVVLHRLLVLEVVVRTLDHFVVSSAGEETQGGDY